MALHVPKQLPTILNTMTPTNAQAADPLHYTTFNPSLSPSDLQPSNFF